jgi:hypothetical protein
LSHPGALRLQVFVKVGEQGGAHSHDDGLHDRRLTQIFRELCLALRPEQLDFADSAIFSDIFKSGK